MSLADDVVEIQMLAQRYADAVMRNNADDWTACWAEEGSEWYLGMPDPIRGKEAILNAWKGAMAGFPFAVFMVQPSIVSVNGDTATSRCYVDETLQDADGNVAKVYGVYNDDLVRENGSWKFKVRRYHVIYRGKGDLSGDQIGYKD